MRLFLQQSVLLTLVTILVAGCSQFERRESHPSKRKADQPFEDSKETETQEQVSPTRKSSPKNVALILGPGGYKTFAHAGVIKELRKKNIPIHKIVGLEWGALVAALYAQRAQINEAEWKLYKLEKLSLNRGGFFSRKKETQSLSDLTDYLKENLNSDSTSRTDVPFFCPSLQLSRGVLQWQEMGPLWQTVSNCLAFPPLFYPEKNQFVAGVFSLQEVVSKLKKSGADLIVFVNVLGEGNLFENIMLRDDYATALLWNEARRSLWQARNYVSEVIDVPTKGISISDFESRKLLVTAGERAGSSAASTLIEKYGF